MTFQERIAAALERVIKVAKAGGGNIIHTSEISRFDREILLKTQWLQPIIKGWYMISRPDVRPGESSIWYANFWKFISRYLSHYFKKNYCLSAESSIDLHTDSPTIPAQVIAIVAKKGSKPVALPFQTSLLPYPDLKNIPDEKLELKKIQVMELGYALCKATPIFFEKQPQKLEIALRLIRSPDELLEPILKHGLHTAAARLIGAYRFLGDHEMANKLQEGLQQFGFQVKEENPFGYAVPQTDVRAKSPYVSRILALWKSYRPIIIESLPKPPGIFRDKKEYFAQLAEVYKDDAYNSLSIEGYDVNEGLIEKVRNHKWNPDDISEDKDAGNAMAARGYYEAFEEVKKSISKILDGANPGEVLERDLSKWYQGLFAPSVKAGLLNPHDIIGYRKLPVYIRGSRHIPLPREALLDAMEALFTCLKEEPHAGVRGILGHFIFVYIHPYIDGNGRIGRFLMNAMFSAGGYPWTIVHVSNRKNYISFLEEAGVSNNIKPFAEFIAKEMQNIKGKGAGPFSNSEL